jgi:hypothetical protein
VKFLETFILLYINHRVILFELKIEKKNHKEHMWDFKYSKFLHLLLWKRDNMFAKELNKIQ